MKRIHEWVDRTSTTATTTTTSSRISSTSFWLIFDEGSLRSAVCSLLVRESNSSFRIHLCCTFVGLSTNHNYFASLSGGDSNVFCCNLWEFLTKSPREQWREKKSWWSSPRTLFVGDSLQRKMCPTTPPQPTRWTCRLWNLLRTFERWSLSTERSKSVSLRRFLQRLTNFLLSISESKVWKDCSTTAVCFQSLRIRDKCLEHGR